MQLQTNILCDPIALTQNIGKALLLYVTQFHSLSKLFVNMLRLVISYRGGILSVDIQLEGLSITSTELESKMRN